MSTLWLDSLFRVSQGQNQGFGRTGLLTGGFGQEFALRLLQVAVRLQFFGTVGLGVTIFLLVAGWGLPLVHVDCIPSQEFPLSIIKTAMVIEPFRLLLPAGEHALLLRACGVTLGHLWIIQGDHPSLSYTVPCNMT